MVDFLYKRFVYMVQPNCLTLFPILKYRNRYNLGSLDYSSMSGLYPCPFDPLITVLTLFPLFFFNTDITIWCTEFMFPVYCCDLVAQEYIYVCKYSFTKFVLFIWIDFNVLQSITVCILFLDNQRYWWRSSYLI